MQKKSFVSFTSSLIILASCTNSYKPAKISVKNMLDGVAANEVNERILDKPFTDAVANFSLSLFNRIHDEKNALLSPLSVYLALSMAANGALENTLLEMENVLGEGMPMAKLNEYLHSFLSVLSSSEKSKLNIANSIWFRETNIEVNPEFLQTNKDYYDAASYKAPFDQQTVKDINNWVKNNTENLIKKIVDEIKAEDVMYLINTVLFDAEWQTNYKKDGIQSNIFTNYTGVEQNVKFMNSIEQTYLSDIDGTKGFIKPYAQNKYSFAAILPPENTDVYTYAALLKGTDFLNLMENKQSVGVNTYMPKFDYECSYDISSALQDMGIKDAFHNANFKRLGTSPLGNIEISEVKHKTYISVDEKGTKAGAATSVSMTATSAAPSSYSVILNRPFMYAIIENTTNLPIFIGICSSI